MDRINFLESEKDRLEREIEYLEKKVSEFRHQLGEYWKVKKTLGHLFGKLRPNYQLAVDENGRQPPDWTLSFCLQQFEELETERIGREAFCENELRKKDAHYQQEMRSKDEDHQREKRNLQIQISEAINIHENKKREMEAKYVQDMADLMADHAREKKTLIETHNREAKELSEWVLGESSFPVHNR